MTSIKILYTEDDDSFARLIQQRLQQEGFIVETANTPAKAYKLFREFRPDLMLVDLDLQQEKEGLKIIRDIHLQSPWFPVIVYSAHIEPALVVETMNLGVMHHIGKDRSLPELVAMIRNAHRQSYRYKGDWNPEYQLSGLTTFNIRTHILSINGREEHLTPITGKLMKQLCLHINEFVSSQELNIAVWGIEKNLQELRRYIKKLRSLIETQDPDIRILNKIGGYYQLECKAWK